MSFAPEDLAACAEREVRMRERVYPRWVGAGKLTQARADQELAMMREIARVLRAQVPAPPPDAQGSLFEPGRRR